MFLKVKSVDYDDDSSGDFDLLIQWWLLFELWLVDYVDCKTW